MFSVFSIQYFSILIVFSFFPRNRSVDLYIFTFFLCPGIAFFVADARMTSNQHVAHHELYHSLNILLNNTRIKRSQFLFTINTTSRTKTKKKKMKKRSPLKKSLSLSLFFYILPFFLIAHDQFQKCFVV